MKEATNAAVLVIDDEEMVRNDIEEILMPRKSTPEKLHPSFVSVLLEKGPALQTARIPRRCRGRQ